MLYEAYYKYKWRFQRIFVVCQVYWSFSLTHQAIKITKNDWKINQNVHKIDQD